MDRITAAAQLTEASVVVEVGPGKGALTRRLLPRVNELVAIEMDADLALALPGRVGNPANLTVLCDDARTADLGAITEGPPYKVVANLPYYAANPIVRRFLELERRPELMVVMVQREVAESMTAAPGNMSILSVATQLYAKASIVCHVPPRAFRPVPKVTSSVVKLEVFAKPPLEGAQAASFFELVRAGFSAPRKQLRNSLSHGLGVEPAEVGQLLEDAGISGTRRPGTLSIEEWQNLFGTWQASGSATQSPSVAGANLC